MSGADAIVVGGGAASIAAARTLHDAGRDVLIVEAKDRLGGRAHSISFGDIGIDLGCGWLHSAKRNPFTTLADAQGFSVDRSPANWRTQWRDLGFPPDDQKAFRAAWQDWEDAAHAALNGPDRPLSDFIGKHDRWQPMLDAISGFANGAPLAHVSLHDWAAYEDAATGDNWAVREGYGTLVEHQAQALAVSLDTPVKRIDHTGRTIRVETPRGTLETEAVILCVPASVLADDGIAFDPPLPAKRQAAANLPLGLADKVFLKVSGLLPWPTNAHLTGNPRSNCTASHRLSPFGAPVIESFFGGDCAEGLEREGDGAAAAFAIDELVGLLGSEWRVRLEPVAATRWRAEPYIHGSYSHARIGHAADRAVLAESIDCRLFFAGEACSPHDFSTCHGAWQTGIAAANALLAVQ